MQEREPEPDVPTLGQNRADRRKAKRTRRIAFAQDMARLKAFRPRTKARPLNRGGRRKR